MEGLENIEQCYPEINIWQGINQEHWQCANDDYLLAKDLDEAIGKIGLGEDFAFYDMHLSDAEKVVLANIEIAGFNNIEIGGGGNIENKVRVALTEMVGIEFFGKEEEVTYIIDKLIRSVASYADKTDITIRSRDKYIEDLGCLYWHLDKDGMERGEETRAMNEKRFIIVLKGESTLYKQLSFEKKLEFLEYAEETPYYYGHGLDGCDDNDKINKLVGKSRVKSANYGFGAVHIPGKAGAIHAAPGSASVGRKRWS
jgi:hypothetical protein